MTAPSHDQEPEPNWSLLPGRAMQFFGLEAGYDKKDLKRAYNRWIRRFKPEQFPEEFQRIRAGYERLEEALRFGSIDSEQGFLAADSMPFSSAGSASRSSSPASPTSSPGSPSKKPAEAADLAALVREHSLEDLTQLLRRKPDKSAREWILLGLASEEAAAADAQESVFLNVILDGFAAHRGPTLTRLLFNLLREKPPAEEIETILRRLHPNSGASSLTPQSYFAFTSPLWETFLREQPFARFAKLLRECRDSLGEASDPAYLPLLLRLVRIGAFKADDEWLADSLELLEETYHSMPPPMQEEMDLFDFFDRYRQRRTEFLDGNPLRDKIDRVMQKITAGPEVEADQAFLALQTYLIDHREEALTAFPHGPEDFGHVMYPLHLY
ncbi:MAG: hypothetical protein AAF368_11190, partial [Planctomycetota bacterium]